MEIKIKISYIIIFLVTISSPSSSFSTNTSVVLDVDDNQLEANTEYKVFSPNQGGGGGLVLSIRDTRYPCPINIMQENNQSFRGFSLQMFPVDNKQVHISMNSDLNIMLLGASICVQPTVWRLDNRDPFTGVQYVKTNGVLGKPGPHTVKNWFKLERFGEGYKILYCPSVCTSCRVDCGEVGLYVEKTKRCLGLGGQPLIIAFKKN